MTRSMVALIVAALLVPALVGVRCVRAQGRVYMWTDEHGTVHFSNGTMPARYADRAEVRASQGASKAPKPATTTSSIPLVNRDQKKFVSALIEGARGSRHVTMIVDTGAQMTMIDEDTAAELGVEFVEEMGIIGVTGVAPGWIGRVRRVQVGDKEVRDWSVMVGPMPGVLLLGMDVLQRLHLTIGKDTLEAD